VNIRDPWSSGPVGTDIEGRQPRRWPKRVAGWTLILLGVLVSALGFIHSTETPVRRSTPLDAGAFVLGLLTACVGVRLVIPYLLQGPPLGMRRLLLVLPFFATSVVVSWLIVHSVLHTG
jgi:hypothetical protein